MKNTLVIDLDDGCNLSCMERLSDGTNRLLIDARTTQYDSAIFNLSADGYSVNAAVALENNSYLLEVPTDLIFVKSQFTLNIGGIAQIKSIYFLNQDIVNGGNLFIRQQSDFGYILKCAVKNSTGVPIATKQSLGVVRVGQGLDIDTGGILSNSAEDISSLTVAEIESILI